MKVLRMLIRTKRIVKRQDEVKYKKIKHYQEFKRIEEQKEKFKTTSYLAMMTKL